MATSINVCKLQIALARTALPTRVPWNEVFRKAIKMVGTTSVLLALHHSPPAICCVMLMGDATATGASDLAMLPMMPMRLHVTYRKLQQKSRKLRCVPLLSRCPHGSLDCRLQMYDHEGLQHVLFILLDGLTACHRFRAKWNANHQRCAFALLCAQLCCLSRERALIVNWLFAATLLKVHCYFRPYCLC